MEPVMAEVAHDLGEIGGGQRWGTKAGERRKRAAGEEGKQREGERERGREGETEIEDKNRR